ncbi:hypothetical protein GCM10009785_08720 [Brooklawnia cerclae]|uniref:Uncharacterized protein n=1 Tax=Brooklawnia cerclae TaxID=349934 RepID=A0ABX0SJE3_9ACTN|nr:hypothetical protein [Brooklawnia cerclae]NIH58449.1 hypothetical protein [Brooklawnia cerclae]
MTDKTEPLTDADVAHVRLSDDLRSWLLHRAELHAAPPRYATRVRTELVLWRAVLAAELARVRLTLPEIGLIADVCNGTMADDAIGTTIGTVATQIIDATYTDPGIWGTKWDVDESGLRDKLAALGPAADIALADAVADWWERGLDHTVEGWANVGLRVTEG